MLWDENWVPFLRRTKGICTMPFCLDLCCDTDFFLAEGHPTREREFNSVSKIIFRSFEELGNLAFGVCSLLGLVKRNESFSFLSGCHIGYTYFLYFFTIDFWS
jgi:hypothetical protein